MFRTDQFAVVDFFYIIAGYFPWLDLRLLQKVF